MLSTLVLAASAHNDLANLAEIMGKLEAAPHDEMAVSLGKYNTCPGASNAAANIHTMAQMKVTFSNSCAEVAEEIQARASHEAGWIDPHNNGRYTLLGGANGGMITTKRITGNRRFTDKQTFALQDTANGGCEAQICSESQGTSANDGGTNLCDMFDLFCNSGETNQQNGVSCKPVKNDLQYTVQDQQCGRFVFANNYAGHRCENAQTTCLKVGSQEHANVLETLEEPPKNEIQLEAGAYRSCPGASGAVANIHTKAQMRVEFSNSCAEVAEEIQARGNHEAGWVDPHNNGRYNVLNAQSNMITLKRVTGNGVFTDKQTFALQDTGAGCTAYACSESQGTSANDGGTNLCDMFDLFCNSGETNQQNGVSCKPVKNDLQYTIQSRECGRYVFGNNYAGHQCENAQATCLKVGGNNSLEAPTMRLSYL